MNRSDYTIVPFGFKRKAVAASAAVSGDRNAIHAVTEVDLSVPRAAMQAWQEKTGIKPSLTAYVVTCLAHTLARHPQLNSFRRGNRLVLLKDVTVSVLIERDYDGEKVPEPVGIAKAQDKSWTVIQEEIREAQSRQGRHLGSLSGMTWVRLIPGFLMRAFFRMADRSLRLGVRYGKVSVTAVGMFSRDAVWFIPHGTATVLVTVGGIGPKVIPVEGGFEAREHLCLTVSFDHAIVDGAPASRFMSEFITELKSGRLCG